MTELRLRIATRAVVMDEADRVLLVRFGCGVGSIWTTPGGGVEEAETDEESIRRELAEETGLEVFKLGSHVWTRTAHVSLGDGRWDGEIERIYLVRTAYFEPAPRLGLDGLRAEGVSAIRWWTLDELEATAAVFAPRRLPALVRELIVNGPPPAPVDVGV